MTDLAELAKRVRARAAAHRGAAKVALRYYGDHDAKLDDEAAAMLDQLASTMSAEEVSPFDAFHGGAKVFGAISEVVKYGGSVERALKAGEAALDNLRPAAPCP